jgi:hypothetical protein
VQARLSRNNAAVTGLVGALLAQADQEWQVLRRYFSYTRWKRLRFFPPMIKKAPMSLPHDSGHEDKSESCTLK